VEAWINIPIAEEWLKIALVAGSAALLGTIVGAWLSRPRRAKEAPARTDPVALALEQKAPSEKPALKSFRAILEKRGVGGKELNIQLEDFARQFAELQESLRRLAPADPANSSKIDQALESLDAGNFGQTLEILTQLGNSDVAAGRELKERADTHLSAAAAAKVVAGDLHMAQMAYGDALQCYTLALDALPRNAGAPLAEYLNKHGTAAYHVGDHTAATDSFGQALVILERTLGDDHPDLATALNNLALLHYSQANYEAAQPLYERALAIDEKVLGPDHPGVATDLNNLALLHKKQGNFEAAEPLLRRALDIKEKVFDPGHYSLVMGLKNYASLLRVLDRVEEAETLETRAALLPSGRNQAAE
jgi:tetratricopeptide (TPR) repeat protein